jgi:Flp pilus assembly protein TadG
MKNRRGSRGAVMIEAVLTLMLFLIFVFSLFDFGYVLFVHHTLMHQARTAARYGILIDASTGENQTKIRNVFLFNDPDGREGATTGTLGLNASNVTVAFRPKTTGTPVARLMITVQGYQFGLITPGFAGIYGGQNIVASLPMEYQ